MYKNVKYKELMNEAIKTANVLKDKIISSTSIKFLQVKNGPDSVWIINKKLKIIISVQHPKFYNKDVSKVYKGYHCFTYEMNGECQDDVISRIVEKFPKPTKSILKKSVDTSRNI